MVRLSLLVVGLLACSASASLLDPSDWVDELSHGGGGLWTCRGVDGSLPEAAERAKGATQGRQRPVAAGGGGTTAAQLPRSASALVPSSTLHRIVHLQAWRSGRSPTSAGGLSG